MGHQAKRTWQSDLVATYAHFFIITEQGQTYTPGYPTVGDGWRELLETAFARIANAMAAAPSGWLRVVQVKEKFGSLRLYWRGKYLSAAVEHGIEDAVALAEARSACTCEICGAAGVLHSRGGWLATACAAHARGEPVPVKKGFENLHIVRTFNAGYPIASCRRYDRAADKFVDVDPRSLSIQE